MAAMAAMAATGILGTETTMSCSIPTEIITHEIFPKLPAKSLLRFKCLSKSFYALLSSPEFVQLHLRESRSSDANRLLILTGEDNCYLYSIDVDSPTSVTKTPLPRISLSTPGSVSIVGSFNGLICLEVGSGTKYILVNPSTRVIREIPRIDYRPIDFPNIIRSSFGFGFDDLNGDYKLVRVMDLTRFNLRLGNLRLGINVSYREVIVYSLNQITWKVKESVKDPKDSLMERQNGALIKNHLLHWVFSDSNHYRIGCFDTRSDKWVRDVPLMQLIDTNNNNEFRVRSLGVMNGCLCLSTATTSSEDLWMLKDYEARESWVKLFHITPFLSSHFFQFTQPFLCFSRESKYEVLVGNLNRKELFWYDIGPITYGMIKPVKRIPTFVGGCLYTGSLVEIPGGYHIIQDKLNDLFSMLMLM